jgi:hypothetical protein
MACALGPDHTLTAVTTCARVPRRAEAIDTMERPAISGQRSCYGPVAHRTTVRQW